MWRLIDKEMSLRECSIYCYAPEEDPYDGEEGSLWSLNYFFFNKSKKRVCYLYLRGFSILDTTPAQKTPVRAKRPASGTWSVDEDTSRKRARFWLGDRAADVECVADGDEETLEEEEVLDTGDEPRYVPSDTDTGDESPCKGRGRSINSDMGSLNTSKGSGRDGSSVRGISEEIGASMDP